MALVKLFLSATLTLVFAGGSLSGQRCGCAAPSPGETTRDGANYNIVLLEKRKHAGIKGTVRDPNGDLLSDVLVEVFDNPNQLSSQGSQNIEEQKPQRRIAACVVESDGRFCFANIPAGKYEVRFSKNSGWNHTSVVLTVAPRKPNATKRGLNIRLELGT